MTGVQHRAKLMQAPLSRLKDAAIESYVSLCSKPGRRLRSTDKAAGARCQRSEDRDHLVAATEWICRAHDVGDDDGVSALYSLVEGWTGSYPETTGYIIPTLFNAAKALENDNLSDRALEMADWLLKVQLPNGAFPGSFVGRLATERVFNTGQAIFGLVQAGEESGDNAYMEAALRAGDWLLQQQDADGAWRRATLSGGVHTYNTRSAWALARLASACGDTRFHKAALSNADWALTEQSSSGWYRNNSFRGNDLATTLHTVCYAARGLLEIGNIAETTRHIHSAKSCADALHRVFVSERHIPGAFSDDWTNAASWRCLPGEAQLFILWMRLTHILDCTDYISAAATLLQGLTNAQILSSDSEDFRGAISGSYPINAPYERYCLVSWGAKFFIDALLIKESHHEHTLFG